MLGRSMRALGLALIVAMLLPLLPAAAVFAGTGGPDPSALTILAEGQPEPAADPTPTPPDPTPTPDPGTTPDPTARRPIRQRARCHARPMPRLRRIRPARPIPIRRRRLTPTPAWRPRPRGRTHASARARDRLRPGGRRYVAPVRPAQGDGPAPTLLITRPAAGTTIFVRANQATTVEWTEALDGDPVARSVTEEAGQIDPNGICAAAEATPTWTRDGLASPLTVSDLAVDSCYRYVVELKLKGGDTLVGRSGWFRVLKAWTGTINLYRSGVFSTQRRTAWCVGASIQMMRNIVKGESDRSYTNQETYQRSARSLDLYVAGDGAKGSDPEGWAAALRVHGAGDSYHVVEKAKFRGAVRAAVRALRKTGKPVGLLVGHGSHAWVMTGFSATADPAVTNASRSRRCTSWARSTRAPSTTASIRRPTSA